MADTYLPNIAQTAVLVQKYAHVCTKVISEAEVVNEMRFFAKAVD
jgi:hypothetical protein